MGVALQYACRTNKKIHEAILNIDPADVDGEQGIDKVLSVLDELHNVDQKESAVNCYEKFLSLKRKPNQRVAEFILEFESLSNKVTASGNVLSPDLLACRLLQAVNLSETDERIIKCSVANFTVKDITAVLKKSYGESTYDSVEIKPEPIFHTGACKVINDQKTEGH